MLLSTQNAFSHLIEAPCSLREGVSFMPAPGSGGRLLWVAVICFGWLVMSENVSFGQAGSRPGTVKPSAKSAANTNTKAQPGKGKPVSTKGEESSKAATPEAKPNPVKEGDKGKDTTRWREGHRLENVTVTFQISETERFLVALSSEKGLTALENMALERIADAMRTDSADNRWVVTGRITEFRGQNYLWIERATRAAKIAGQ